MMAITCGACGLALDDINEPCPDCLPGLAWRPPVREQQSPTRWGPEQQRWYERTGHFKEEIACLEARCEALEIENKQLQIRILKSGIYSALVVACGAIALAVAIVLVALEAG